MLSSNFVKVRFKYICHQMNSDRFNQLRKLKFSLCNLKLNVFYIAKSKTNVRAKVTHVFICLLNWMFESASWNSHRPIASSKSETSIPAFRTDALLQASWSCFSNDCIHPWGHLSLSLWQWLCSSSRFHQWRTSFEMAEWQNCWHQYSTRLLLSRSEGPIQGPHTSWLPEAHAGDVVLFQH